MIISIALIAAVAFFDLSVWALFFLLITGIVDVSIAAIYFGTRQLKTEEKKLSPRITQYINPHTGDRIVNFGYNK